MTINLIDSILKNRTNTITTPIDCYGPNGKQLWAAFNAALYDWSVAETDETRNAAFDAGRGIFAAINAELEDGRKIKFTGVEDLNRYRDAAVRFTNKDNAATMQLKAVRAFAAYRAGQTDKCSFSRADYELACHIAKTAPTPDYAMSTAAAEALIELCDKKLTEAKEAKTAKQKIKTTVGVEAFRKSCEVLIAEKLDSVLAMTTEQIKAERNARTRARRDARNAAKQKAEAAENKAA